jgi:CRISPR-associated protein Csx17
MTVHVHKLEGCAPTPLAHYLKALAILRLLEEQRDPQVRGWWKDEAFWLSTELSREELLRFFLERYEPTPILSPWNGGSGFYFREGKTKEKDESGRLKKTGVRDEPTAATRALDALLANTSPRLARYRQCASVAKAVIADLGLREAPGDEEKATLIAGLRSRLPELGLRWLDAAVTSLGDEFACAPLVGSGGNDGNEDFSKNFLERVHLLLGAEGAKHARDLLVSSLFGSPVRGAFDIVAGQFFPGGNGGANAGAGFDGRSTANSWDYVLAVEGSLLFAGSASRRLNGSTSGAAFPFAVRLDAAGYGSAADADRDASRFELWLPVWTQPASANAVAILLKEGRARVDRADAHRTTDVARAIGSLGIDRGITGFERTAFFTRNGNMHYSAPVGRWEVASQPHEELLDDIDPWVRRVRAFARDRLAPKAITSAARIVDEAILSVCRSGHEAARWQALLVALGEAETAILRSPQKTADAVRGLSPLPALRPAWIKAADDGSPELRLAIALASQDAVLTYGGREITANIRAHWMPLDRTRAARWAHAGRAAASFAKDASGLANDPDVVCVYGDLERDCIALMRRRVQMAVKLAGRGIGLVGARGAEAPLADVMRFVRGDIDDARVAGLSRGLMAIAWWTSDRPRLDSPSPDGPDAAYAIARIAHLTEPLDRGERVRIAIDPEPIARLIAGDLADGVAICLRRLRASGMMPLVQVLVGSGRYSRRLAASLAFPISPADARRCADLIAKPDLTKETPDAR